MNVENPTISSAKQRRSQSSHDGYYSPSANAQLLWEISVPILGLNMVRMKKGVKNMMDINRVLSTVRIGARIFQIVKEAHVRYLDVR